MAFVIIFMSLIVGVYSQTFCMSLSLTTTGEYSEFNNGQFVDKGGSNDGKPYYEMDNTNQTGCDNPGYLYWNNNPANNWFIGKSLFLWKFKCTTIINNNDPSTCTNWDDSGNNAVGAILIAGNCPYDAMCDTITLSQPAGNCSGVFNYIKPNQFTNGNGQYLIYQEKIEKWICWKNIINVIGCPLFAIPNTWRQDDPSGMKRPFQDGDSQTYDGIAHGSVQNSIEFTCSGHNTRNPTPAPSYSPTQPSNSPTKRPSNNPTNTPTKHPSNNPTTNPSKSPTNIPTTPIPSANPSQIPTHSPSIPTSNPSRNPTMNPTLTPTRNPTNTPTYLTIDPSTDPTSVPPTKAPTSLTVNPTTSNPTNKPTNLFVPFRTTTSTTGDNDLLDLDLDFNYYWTNYSLYMIIGGAVLILLLSILCWCCCCRDPKTGDGSGLRRRRARINEMRRRRALRMQSNQMGNTASNIQIARVTSQSELH